MFKLMSLGKYFSQVLISYLCVIMILLETLVYPLWELIGNLLPEANELVE